MKKNTKIILLALFAITFLIKAIIIKFNYGPLILPDEGCIIETAKYFAQHFSIPDCSMLSKMPSGNAPQLTPIVFSIFYFFLTPLMAYKGILLFHALLTSALIFPLYKIGKSFIKKDSHLIPISALLLFIPQIFGYQYSVMSETLFAVANIWTIYFYHEYSRSKKPKYKISAFIMAFLAIFMRPFGIMTITALAITEIILNRKNTKHLITALTICSLGILTFIVSRPDIANSIISTLTSVSSSTSNIYFITNAFINQLNSLIGASLAIPFIIFVCLLLNRSKYPAIKNTLMLAGVIVVLNLFISAIPLYSYYTQNMAIGLSTRYINVAIIIVFVFGIFGLYEMKKITKTQFAIVAFLTVLSLINIAANVLNLQYIYEYLHVFLYKMPFFSKILMPLTILLAASIALLGMRKTVICALISTSLLHTTMSTFAAIGQKEVVTKNNSVFTEFQNTKNKILFLVEFPQQVPYTYWELKTITQNTVDVLFYKKTAQGELEYLQIEKEGAEITIDTSQYDYVITSINLDLPLYKMYIEGLVYKIK